MKIKMPLLIGLAVALVAGVAAQDKLTGQQFFGKLSERYAAIKDYEATVNVKAGKSTMAGTMIFKAPTLLRMDFTQPANQTILYNGENLIVYVPELRATLSQQTSSTSGASAATGEGLKMLGRSYDMAYETTPDAVPLPGSESEMVIRLKLDRRTVAEGFRTIILSVDPVRMLIRRMDGVTIAGDTITYDFTGIKLDQGIPDTRFLYDAPASANVYNNFLFSTDK